MRNHEESPLMGAAVALNEMFLTLCASGFSEEHALRLIAFLIEDMQFSSPEQPH